MPNRVWGNKGQQVRDLAVRRGVQNQGELRDWDAGGKGRNWCF